jgi:hypothetical protein
MTYHLETWIEGRTAMKRGEDRKSPYSDQHRKSLWERGFDSVQKYALTDRNPQPIITSLLVL